MPLPLRIAHAPVEADDDARVVAPWFHRPAGDPRGSRPALLTFSENGFVDLLKAALAASGEAFVPTAWPALKPFRDWSEPPDTMLTPSGAPRYPASVVKRRDPDPAELDTRTAAAPPRLDATLAGEEAPAARWLRKLYLPFHQHHHFVACELVCDRRGFPRIDSKRVTDAGFVLRRLVPDPQKERWEDWLPAPDGRSGVWVELAAEIAAVDPDALTTAQVGGTAVEAEARARLGIDATKPLRLGSTKLNPLPPSLGASDSHTGYFGYLATQSREQEAPPVPPADVSAAVTAMGEAVGDALEAAWTTTSVATYSNQITTAWNALVAAVVAYKGDGSGESPALYDGMLASPSLTTAIRPAPTSTSPTVYPALLTDGLSFQQRLAVLWHVRGARLTIRQALAPMFGAVDTARQVTVPSRTTPTSTVTVTAWTVGSFAEEIDTALAWLDAGQPLPGADVTIDRSSLEMAVHTAANAVAAAFARFNAPLAEAGEAGAAYVDGLVKTSLGTLDDLDGSDENAPREWGVDLDAPLERALFGFPGLLDHTTDVELFEQAVAGFYSGAAAAITDDGEIDEANAGSEEAALARSEQLRLARLTPARLGTDRIYCVQAWARVSSLDPCAPARVAWSPPSEPFTLAEPMDVLGLKPQPVQLPDIPKLVKNLPRIAKAGALPFGAVHLPKDSGVKVGEDPKDTAREWGIAFICSFGIPVFTIVAWVLFYFMFAILLLIPGFAWMLLLKFCLPVPVPAKKG